MKAIVLVKASSFRSYCYHYCHPAATTSCNARHWSGSKAALLEAYAVTVSLLPSSLRAEFPVIGGASLVILGSKRKTEDVDFAVSPAALFAFEEAACNHSRFSKGAVAEWTYSCQGEGIEEVKVSLEFLQMGGDFAPNIKVVKPVGEGFRAGMGELVRMKANAYTARGEDKDLEDFGQDGGDRGRVWGGGARGGGPGEHGGDSGGLWREAVGHFEGAV